MPLTASYEALKMAIITHHWELSVTLLDVGNATMTKSYELIGADYTAAAANAVALVSDLSGVTDLEITGYRLAEVFLEETVVVPTALNAQKEMQGRAVLQLATSPLKKVTHDIPGPKDTLFTGAPGTNGYDILDPADSFVLAYFDNFRAAGGPTATISDGEAILAGAGGIVRGRRTHRSTSINNPG